VSVHPVHPRGPIAAAVQDAPASTTAPGATRGTVAASGPGRRGGAGRRGSGPRNAVVYVALVIGAALSLAPLLIVLLGSFRPTSELLSDPLGLPRTLDVSNYVEAWLSASLGSYMVNSLLVTVGALALCLAVSLPVAYALGRWTFFGRDVLAILFLAGLMVPIRIGILPLFHLYEGVGLIDSPLGLVLLYAATGIPMAVLILTAFYRQLPDALEDAARIDGAGEVRIFATIMTPLVRPAVAAVLVLNVGPVWNDFFMPLILLRSPDSFTLPVGITSFFTQYSADRGLLFAGLVIAALPLVVLFAFAMRSLVSGLTAGIEK
jgi:raffinose/stachyose/melibiose transport system permease protein